MAYDHWEQTAIQNAKEAEVYRREILELQTKVAELKEVADKAERGIEHTQAWYATRMENLKDLGVKHGIWSEMADILANGHTKESPENYAALLNQEKFKSERNEKAMGEILKTIHLAKEFRIPANDVFATIEKLIDGTKPKKDVNNDLEGPT